MDLNAMRMFVATAHSGSLTAAAERLEVPLATISRRVRDLERELNVQLLQRSVHGTCLTDAGMRLYQHARRGLEMLENGERALMSDQSGLSGLLRLSLPSSLKPWWGVLSEFQQRYPDITLHVQTTDKHINVIEDDVDVAMCVGRTTDRTLASQSILNYRHVLVGAPALLQSLGTPVKITDLYKFPCGVWSQDTKAIWHFANEIFDPEPTITTNDYTHLCSRVLAGDIVTELPPFMATEYIKKNQLVVLLKDYPLAELELTLHSPAYPSLIVQTYLDFARRHIENLTRLQVNVTGPQSPARAYDLGAYPCKEYLVTTNH